MASGKVVLALCLSAALATSAATVVHEAYESVQHFQQQQQQQLLLPAMANGPPSGPGKRVLWPLDRVDLALFLICTLCLSLAGGAGIGGGAILVPVFILVRGWPTATAVALSNVTILGGSFANFICNVNRHRPNGSRVIDWELILMMEPTTIAGALFGAMLNKIMPNYITTYLLTVMLSFMTLRLFQKAKETHNKETVLLEAAKAAARAAHHAAKATLRLQAPTGAQASNLSVSGRQKHLDHSGSSQGRQTSLTAAGQARAGGSSSSSRAPERLFSRSLSNRFLLSEGTSPSTEDAGPLANRLSVQRTSFLQSLSQRRLSASAENSPLTRSRNSRLLSSSLAQQVQAAALAAVDQQRFADIEGGGAHAAPPPADEGVPVSEEAAQLVDSAPWLPAMLKQDSRRQLMGPGDSLALFQGDFTPAVEQPIVSLPAQFSDSGSSSRSGSEDGEAGSTAPARGAAGTAPGGSDWEADVPAGDAQEVHNELLRPLLTVEAPEGSSDDVAQQQDRDVAASGRGSTDKHSHHQADADKHVDGRGVDDQLDVIESSIPLPHFATLVLLSAWVVASDISQGSFRCGSWQYWVITLSVLIPVAAILLVFRQILLKKYRHDELPPGVQLPDGQLHWNRSTTLLYPLYCSAAGLIAGLFGIGGGVVKGPLMLELGVPADVAAATSATMIMFTAGSACVVYSRFGQILPDYAVVLITLGFTVTLLSQLLTFFLVRLLGRRSIIIFMMVVLMGVACSIMYLESFLEARRIIAHPEELRHFGSICPAPSNQGLKLLFTQLLNQLRA